jgi:LAO/AO transport system kinase
LPDQSLSARVLDGEIAAIARLATNIENETDVGREGLRKLYPHTGTAHIIGITGPPGAGKSTLVNALIHEYRNAGNKIGVVAVDPSSPLSGGAALGDRIRMLDRWDDEHVFIRSMASRGLHGGLAPATAGVIHLLDAAKFDPIIVETVGVGQEQVDVLRFVHTVVVVQVPGLGDDVQALKAGLLEIADLFVVNKADRAGAADSTRILRGLASYRSLDSHQPANLTILKTVATTGEGVPELAKALGDHKVKLINSSEFDERKRRIASAEVLELARRQLSRQLKQVESTDASDDIIADVVERRMAPADGANRLVDTWKNSNSS